MFCLHLDTASQFLNDMKKALSIISGVMFFLYAGAQVEIGSDSTAAPITEEQVYSVVTQMPVYPEGQEALERFISENIVYPQPSIENSIQGTIVVAFIVEKDGSTSNHSIIRTVSYGAELNKEALRICRLLKFNPGTQNGEAVRVNMNIPIKFDLREERKKKKSKE
jgi:TonB family protein